MRIFGVFFLGFLLFYPTIIVAAEESFEQESEGWTQLATQIEQEVEDGRWVEAKQKLAELAKQFSQSNLAEKHLGVEGIHVLSEVLLDLEKELNRIRPDRSRIQRSALRLQLAFDAVNHSNQPLWKDFYEVLKNDLTQIREAGKTKNTQSIKQAIAQFAKDYAMVRPALVIAKSPMTMEKVDSLLTFLKSQQDVAMIIDGVRQFESLLEPLFFGSEKDVMLWMDANSPISMSAYLYVIAGVLLLVLIYVSWQKYLQEFETPS